MSRAIAALIAGLFAFASASALAAETAPQSKQAELNKVIAGGNANAPARGEAIKKSATGSTAPMMLADSSTHQQMLDKTISSGNANAPARGKAIADSIHATPRAA
jgi:hypothetical protein